MSVNGLYRLGELHGEKSKAKAREKYGLAPGEKAGVDYINRVLKPDLMATPNTGTSQAPATTTESLFGFDLPKKFAGMPTWMWLTGAGIMVMFFMKGSTGKRR